MADAPTDRSASADTDLVLRTRSGDTQAFGELWSRHYRSGITVARSITSSIDPDDLVQEAYTRIYQAILKGGGPNGSFRAYLFTSIRNTAAAWGRANRETPIDELDTVVDPESTEAAATEALDRGLTAQAFRALPSRWQEVLWYSEIEQMKPAAIAPLLGMSTGAVSQLAFRAREGLREAWIQAHLRSAGAGSECEWTIEQLGAHSRGNLSARAQQRVDSHLDSCARCLIVAAEAKDVSSRLALVLLPLVLGVTGASAYLASLQVGAPIVALAAMPSSVVEGAVVASGVGASAASTGLAGTVSASGAHPGSAGSSIGSSAAGAGSTTGVGALVGVGSAALLVAGALAAAAIVPGVLAGSSGLSQASAAEAASAAISSELAPDGSMSAETPLVIEVDQPVTPPPVAETPPTPAPAPAVPLIESPPDPSPPPQDDSVDTEDPDTENPDTENPDTDTPESPENPDTENPDTENPDTENPDTETPENPDTENPDTENPDTENPDTENPDTENPDTENPDTENPDTENPDTENPETPENPDTENPDTENPDTENPDTENPETQNPETQTLTWGQATVEIDDQGRTHYLIPVHGAPGATVEASMAQTPAVRGSSVVLSEDGTGIVEVRPTLLELVANARVWLRMTPGDSPADEWMSTTLRELRRGAQ